MKVPMLLYRLILIIPWIWFTLSVIFIDTSIFAHYAQKDWEIIELYSDEDILLSPKIIFPVVQVCSKIENIVITQILLQEPDYASPDASLDDGVSLSIWSEYVNKLSFDGEDDFTNDKLWVYYNQRVQTDPHFKFVREATYTVYGYLVAFTISAFFIDFFLGVILTVIGFFLWTYLANRKLRRAGRRTCIQIEMWRRQRERYLRATHYNRGLIRLYYRVPKFFREHTSEDEPDELLPLREPITEESSTDDSINKRYRAIHRAEKEHLDKIREEKGYLVFDSSSSSDENIDIKNMTDAQRRRMLKRQKPNKRDRWSLQRDAELKARMEARRRASELERQKELKLEAERWRHLKDLEQRGQIDLATMTFTPLHHERRRLSMEAKQRAARREKVRMYWRLPYTRKLEAEAEAANKTSDEEKEEKEDDEVDKPEAQRKSTDKQKELRIIRRLTTPDYDTKQAAKAFKSHKAKGARTRKPHKRAKGLKSLPEETKELPEGVAGRKRAKTLRDTTDTTAGPDSSRKKKTKPLQDTTDTTTGPDSSRKKKTKPLRDTTDTTTGLDSSRKKKTKPLGDTTDTTTGPESSEKKKKVLKKRGTKKHKKEN